MDLLTDLPDTARDAVLAAVRDQPGQLAVELAGVGDGRKPRGRRHPLLPILMVAIWAVLGGARSYVAIAEQWRHCADHLHIGAAGTWWAPLLKSGAPSMWTIRLALCKLDVAALEAAVCRWATGQALAAVDAARAATGTARRRAAELRLVISIDGKTLRGTINAAGEQVALVAIMEHATRTILTQAAIVAGDEIAAARTALSQLAEVLDFSGGEGGAGVLVTGDALHTQRPLATWLAEQGGHYLFRVRGNHPTLEHYARSRAWKQVPSTRVYTRAHGRRESRTIRVLSLTQAQSAGIAHLMGGVAQVIAITRTRAPLDGEATAARKPIKTSRETVYYVTSLSAHEADPALLATWIRDHWALENGVHYVRDVTFCEDASRVRTGVGPQVMAALRNLAITLHRLAGQTNIAAACREHAHQPAASLEVVLAA
ncbi:ISAs1 family transposase [Quadrisphaera granulorum]|uniref:ISAs1 family transposase n=1 Tax=Quadrisphaera granulorum TaxID=317664 RepID=UPI001475F729|nr:ISAs1 family transposase [Quadrisphaera granulorum]